MLTKSLNLGLTKFGQDDQYLREDKRLSKKANIVPQMSKHVKAKIAAGNRAVFRLALEVHQLNA